MKRSYNLHLAIFLSIVFSQISAQNILPAQFKTGNVYWNTGQNDFENPDELKNIKFGGTYYFLVQFSVLPDENMKGIIRDFYNLEFCSYLPSNTFYCISKKPIITQDFDRFEINCAKSLAGYNKKDASIVSEIPDYIKQADGSLLITLCVFDPINLTTYKDYLIAKGYEVDLIPGYKPVIHLIANPQQVEELIKLPFVSYAEARQDKPRTCNLPGLTNHRANFLNYSGIGGRNLHGDSVAVGEGDDGYIQPHMDHIPRLSNFYIPQNSDHSDHVAGTIIGAGNINPISKGMADKATILADYFSGIQDDVPAFYPQFRMILTSNSWGSSSGCSSKGIYSYSSAAIDQQMQDYEKVLHVFAASNDGGSSGASCLPYSSGYRTIGNNENSAKNVLTVGALTSADVIAGFSSRGPCYDGRIKPEVSAVGVSVYSTVRTNTYSTKSGTSMATPGTSGTLALLVQRYRQLHAGADADAALYKAILANTADDLGNSGPDFLYGFGRINGRKAVECMEANRYFEGSVSQNDSLSHVITLPSGVSQLKVMLYWCDEAGNPAAAFSLVNNVDLKIYDPSTTLYRPWVLDYSPANCALAATRKTDTLNNIEQITIDNPSSGSYNIVIRGTSIPFGPQKYKLVYDYYSPKITLTYPIGNEKFVRGTTETIYWDNTGISTGTFSLSYSTDSGATYTSISTGLSASTKFYSWTVPQVNSNKCYVKITHSTGNYVDSLLSVFTIAGKPASFTISGCNKKAKLSWGSVLGATSYRVYMIDSNQTGIVKTLIDIPDTFYHISPLTNGKTYWFGVAAIFTGGYVGERANAISITPTPADCNDANDVGIQALVTPATGRANTSGALSASQNITINIRNYSNSSITSVPVSYSINGGAVVNETYSGTVPANGSINYTFSTTANLLSIGSYAIKCYTRYVGDPIASNDTLIVNIRHIANDTFSLPFLEDVESVLSTTVNGDLIGVTGLDAADISSNTVLGRARFNLGTGYTSSGVKSIILDKIPTSTAQNTNYLTLTYNLSNFITPGIYPTLTFEFTHFGEESHAADSVWIRGSDSQPFIPIYSLYSNRPSIGVFKSSPLFNLKTLLAGAGQTLSSSFQIKFGQQDDSATYSTLGRDGFAFDNFRIFDLSNDISMDSVTNLFSSCALPSNSPITVKVTNNSSLAASSIPIAYQINGGSIVRDTIASLAASTTLSYNFTTTANLSLPGKYTIKVWVEWATDQYAINDTFLLTGLYNYGIINTFPHKQNFENNDGNWISGIVNGNQNSWAWGAPGKTLINGAGSGNKCWNTKLTGLYPNNENSILQSPCIDFSGLANPKVSFMVNFSTESEWDFAVLERSINGGSSWQRVDSVNNTKLYNVTSSSSSFSPPGWGNTSGGWVLCQFPLTGMGGQSNCKLRFHFYSDGGVVDEGISIDSIVIYETLPIRTNPADYSVLSNKPTLKGSEWIDVADNSDSLVFSINPNGNNLGSTGWGVRINSGPIRTDSILISSVKYFGYYLDRNFFINPQTQPTTNVSLRFYVKASEMQTIKDSIYNKYNRNIPNDSVDVTRETTVSNNLDPTNHISGTAYALLNATSASYNSDLYLQVSTASFSKFNPSYVPLNTGSYLPVTWLRVSARWVKSVAEISWTVAQEMNVDRYEIEYSWDGNSFFKAGELGSKNNSLALVNYSFLHHWPDEKSNCYYRIKEIDLNGTISYSSIVFLKIEPKINAFPNPADEKLIVQLGNDATLQGGNVEIYSVTGVKYFEKTFSNNVASYLINTSNWPEGLYFLRFSAEQNNSVIKFEVLHH